MTRTTRRRVELAGVIAAGALVPFAGPILGMRHAERWPLDRNGRHRGPVARQRRR